MTLLNAWALGFLALLPVIVFLYLLKVHRRAVAVPTLMFWQRVMQENRRRALFQRLRQWLSLLLHLIIFLLILAALAKPGRFAPHGGSTVLVFDTRARMQTREGAQTRLEQARTIARQYVSRASARNQFALLTIHGSPDVIAPFTGDAVLLKRKLAQLQATDAGSDLAQAVALAQELLKSRAGDKRIVVLSPEKVNIPAAAVPVDHVTIGEKHDNVAISRFVARPLPNSPQTHQVLLELTNYGTIVARGNVEIQLDDNLLDVRPFSLAAGESDVQTFPLLVENAGRGLLVAQLDVQDALAVDNKAYAAVAVSPPQNVLLITRGNWFLEKMLAADDSVRFELLAPEAFTPQMAEQFDAVILDDFVPAEFGANITRGNFLFIRTFPFARQLGVVERPIISEIDTASPLMRLVDWRSVLILRASNFEVPRHENWQFSSPLRAIDSPLVITGTRRLPDAKVQRLAAFAFDLSESDLPLRVAFPLLMRNTLQWLAQRESGYTAPVQAGDAITLESGGRASETARLFRPLRNGFYEVQQQSGHTKWIAVNTFSPAESNLRAGPDAQQSVQSQQGRDAVPWPLWIYLALAGFVLFTIEWWLFHLRRSE